MWLSARELASAGLPGWPASLANSSRTIARIATQSPGMTRPRVGRGGGLEVHIDALPAPARAELARRAACEALAAAPIDASLPAPTSTIDDIAADQRQMLRRALPDLTARQRAVMEARATVLLAVEARMTLDGRGRSSAIATFLASIADGHLSPEQTAVLARANDRLDSERPKPLSRATIYGWFAARERAGLLGLAPAPSRQKSDLPGWFDDFLKFYARPSKPSVAEALRDFAKTLPPGSVCPSERQARACLAKMPQLARLKGREGKLALRTRMAYTARDFSDLLPTSVYSADGKTFDAEVAHPIHGQPFRPEITTIIDVGTRKIVGWSAALDENTFGVVDALRVACVNHGIPAIFYTDRGPGYRNKAMDAPLTGFLARAGITAMRALPYNSQAKGGIERFNQTYTPTAKRLPTYIGREMDKEAKLIAFKTTRRELALTGTSRLLPSWAEFIAAIDADIADYNARPHSSLPKLRDPLSGRARHMTPDEYWAVKCDGFEPVTPEQSEIDDMFRPYVVRRTRRALVEWLGNSYFAPALEAHDGRDVVVGYDLHDASKVWVREIDEVDGERLPGRLIAIAAFEGHKTRYVPHSYEQAAIERRAKGRMARLQKKMDVVTQELRPAALLDLAANAAPTEIQPPDPAVFVISPPPREDGRPMFRDDVEFARWIAENPQSATQSDKELLRDLLSTHSSNELLRMSGVDLEALRSIARSAA